MKEKRELLIQDFLLQNSFLLMLTLVENISFGPSFSL
jgi:hypothetical protein